MTTSTVSASTVTAKATMTIGVSINRSNRNVGILLKQYASPDSPRAMRISHARFVRRLQPFVIRTASNILISLQLSMDSKQSRRLVAFSTNFFHESDRQKLGCLEVRREDKSSKIDRRIDFFMSIGGVGGPHFQSSRRKKKPPHASNRVVVVVHRGDMELFASVSATPHLELIHQTRYLR